MNSCHRAILANPRLLLAWEADTPPPWRIKQNLELRRKETGSQIPKSSCLERWDFFYIGFHFLYLYSTNKVVQFEDRDSVWTHGKVFKRALWQIHIIYNAIPPPPPQLLMQTSAIYNAPPPTKLLRLYWGPLGKTMVSTLPAGSIHILNLQGFWIYDAPQRQLHII